MTQKHTIKADLQSLVAPLGKSVSAARARQRASDSPDPSFATTLARGLDVLAAFPPDGPGLSNSELAERTGLARPTISRLTNTLLQLGYLRRSETGKYLLATRVLRMAYPVLAHLRVRQIARPLMREFAEQMRGTVSIGVVDGTDVVYVETSRVADTVDFVPDIGVSFPLVRASVGRALISMLAEEPRQQLIERIAQETPVLWREHKDNVARSVDECRARGFCVSRGDVRAEIHAVGAPLSFSPDGEALAINCGVPVYWLRNGQLEEEIGPRLAALASAINALLHRAAKDTL